MNIKSAKFNASYGKNISLRITYEDNSILGVPLDEANTAYQAYLLWVSEGGVTEDAD